MPMIGRAAEREALSAAYGRALAGQSQFVVITGPAGIGKTRLVEDLIARSAADDVRSLTGESAPFVGAALAFGPFAAALRDQVGWLVDNDSSSHMLTRRHRLFVRVLGVLTRLAPLLLVLEDLHWADDSSRELLDFLATRLRAWPVMLVATVRDDELDDGARRWLTELECRPRVLRLRLAPLADADIAEVIADLLPAVTSQDTKAAVISAAAGNPLYARELASVGPAAMPASITDAVLASAREGAALTRTVINQVSVADSGMSHELLAATVPVAETRLFAAVRKAVSCGLLASSGDGYAFTHALIRHVIYTQIQPGERRRLHRRLAEALAARPNPDPGLLAEHWRRAGSPDRAAPAAIQAARRAVSVGAYPEASRNYRLALELAGWRPENGPDLLEEAARAAGWAGDPEQAAIWTQAAIWAADAMPGSAAAPPADRARRLERLGRYLWEIGSLGAAVDATEQALGLLDDAGEPSALQARVLAALATRRMLMGARNRTMSLALRSVAIAEQAGAAAVQAHGLATLGTIKAQRGQLDDGLADLRAAFTLARRIGSAEDTAQAAANHVYTLYRAGRFAEALDLARDVKDVLNALDAPPSMTLRIDTNAAAALVASGQWTEADLLLDELITASAASFTRYPRLLQLELAVGRGEHERATTLAETLRKAPEDPRVLGALHGCLAEQALNAGDLGVAAAEVVDGLAALTGATIAEEEIRLMAVGARLSADLALLPEPPPLEIPDEWAPLAATFTERVRVIVTGYGAGQPDVAAFAALVQAEHARQSGRDSRAIWRAVAEAWRKAGRPYREAYARLREAEAASRARRWDQVTRALAACENLARRLQALPLLAQAKDLSRRVRLSGRVVRPSEPDALLDLTGREMDVLAHLVTGDSNRQIARALFISDRTVAVHVSRILDKLGVRNRTEAATVGARLGLLASTPEGESVVYSNLQIAGDPTIWWLAQPVNLTQWTGQTVSIPVTAPLSGTLLLSRRVASVAAFTESAVSAAPTSLVLPWPAIYLPTASGPSAGSYGYVLPLSASLAALEGQISAAMGAGTQLTIDFGPAASGVLVLSGAALPFVVLCPANAGTGQPAEAASH
jgi:DNA-binding CsgD family transcriptional regulator/tetratricopeptide (TPR) repeat protein